MLSNKISQSNTGIQKSNNSSAASPVNPNSSSSVNSTAGLEKGQLIRGEITDLRSKEVSIKLDDGRILAGKLEEASNLAIGDKVVFRVEEVSLKSLTLKIIADSDFTVQENTIDKALEAAGLGKNSRNRSIVKELLNRQMSIDKKTITLLIQQSLLHKDSSIQSLVLMNKYHLPVTAANISQFHAYLNSGHSLLNEIGTLADSITDLFSRSADLPFPDYLKQSSDLLNLLLNRNTESSPDIVPNELTSGLTAANGNSGAVTTGNLLSQAEAAELVSILKSNTLPDSLLSPELPALIQNGSADIRQTAHALNLIMDYANSDSSLSSGLMTELENSSAAKTILSANKNLPYYNNEIGTCLSSSERMNLVSALDSFAETAKIPLSAYGDGFSSLKDRILSGTVTSQDLLKWINGALNNTTGASAKTLLSSKEFKALLKEEILTKWTLDPQTLSKGEDVYRHFKSLLNQLNNLKEYMEQSASSGNATVQGQVNQLHDNISFMNALNEFFTYVQFPLKLKSQYANSELYVYSRKKEGRTAADGIRVLLHLDMEHLGPLDVFIDLHHKNLVSKFYLNKEDNIKLITSHIYLLGEILREKGYSLSAEVLPREKNLNLVEDFLLEDVQATSVTRYNFDIRA